MSETTSQFKAISQRRQAISAEIDSFKAKIMELEVEFSELEIAARVLSRLGLVAEHPPELPLEHNDLPSQKPTVPDMIKIVLKEYDELGIPAPSNNKILLELTHRWGVMDANVVRPTLWRMVKDQRVVKVGEGYSLPKEAPFGGLRPS